MRPLIAFLKANAAPGFEPLVLTSQWRNYAGSSFSSDVTVDEELVNAGTFYNDVGASLNGHASIELVPTGTDKAGLISNAIDAVGVTNLFDANSGSIYVLFSADTAVGDGGDHSDTSAIISQNIVGSPSSTIKVSFSTSGVHAIIHSDGVWEFEEYNFWDVHEVHVPASVGEPHLAQVRWDGATLELRVDDGDWSSTSAGNIELLVGSMVVGWDYWDYDNPTRFDGQIWEIGTSNQVGTDEQFDAILEYVRTYYDVELIAPPPGAAWLNLSAWCRASYTGLPWVAFPSAGDSGTNGNPLTGGSSPPGVGTAQNGFTPAVFARASGNYAYGDIDASEAFTAGEGTIAMVFKGVSAEAPDVNPELDAVLCRDNGASLLLTYTTSGVGIVADDGAIQSVYETAATGSWHVVMARWNGTTLGIRVDGGAEVTTACGSVAFSGGMLFGFPAIGGGGSYPDVEILEIMFWQEDISSDYDDVRDYLVDRYAM